MKNLIVMLSFLSFAAQAHADLVKTIKIEKMNCSGTADARKKVDTGYVPAAPAESNFLFVEMNIDNSSEKPGGTIEFKSSLNGPTGASSALDPDLQVGAGTEGGPAYTQFMIAKAMSVFLQDSKQTPALYKALVSKVAGVKEVEINGSLQINSLLGKNYEDMTMNYAVKCKLSFSDVPMKFPPFAIPAQ